MYSMPGKIAFVKKATVDVVPVTTEIRMDETLLPTIDGHGYFIDEVDNKTHRLTFSEEVTELYIESISVGHLLKNNTLTFTTPIYKWLFSVVDNK